MKQIDISTPTHPDTFALVDDEDFEWLNKHKWTAFRQKKALYAKRNITISGKRRYLAMHTAIMGKVEGKDVDHKNRITLDNQRHNLRHCTNIENQRNKGLPENNTSGYKGVSWNRRHRKWRSHIWTDGKSIYLGSFTCLVKAAKAYDKKAIELFGEFSSLNFP